MLLSAEGHVSCRPAHSIAPAATHTLRRPSMPFVRAIRLSIRAKVLLLALGLALPPLIIVSVMGLSGLDNARGTAVQEGTAALRNQAEANLQKRAIDKAHLYNAALENVQQQVEG